jgi:hypothetical protein
MLVGLVLQILGWCSSSAMLVPSIVVLENRSASCPQTEQQLGIDRTGAMLD